MNYFVSKYKYIDEGYALLKENKQTNKSLEKMAR